MSGSTAYTVVFPNAALTPTYVAEEDGSNNKIADGYIINKIQAELVQLQTVVGTGVYPYPVGPLTTGLDTRLTVAEGEMLLQQSYIGPSGVIIPNTGTGEAYIPGALKVGNTGAGDYLEVSNSGVVTIHGQATVWGNLQFPAQAVSTPGAISDPSRESTTGSYLYSANQTNLVLGFAQMPPSWKEGSRILPYIHWTPTSSVNGDVLWRLYYETKNIDEVFSFDYTTYDYIDALVAANGVENKGQVTGFGSGIDMTGKTLGCVTHWALARLGNDGSDDYLGQSRLLEFDIHYEVDSLGSRESFVK